MKFKQSMYIFDYHLLFSLTFLLQLCEYFHFHLRLHHRLLTHFHYPHFFLSSTLSFVFDISSLCGCISSNSISSKSIIDPKLSFISSGRSLNKFFLNCYLAKFFQNIFVMFKFLLLSFDQYRIFFFVILKEIICLQKRFPYITLMLFLYRSDIIQVPSEEVLFPKTLAYIDYNLVVVPVYSLCCRTCSYIAEHSLIHLTKLRLSLFWRFCQISPFRGCTRKNHISRCLCDER